jgi:MFS family permease
MNNAPEARWKMLFLLAGAELLAMALWFSASAVAPQLMLQWNLSSSQQAWLTMSVQLGFVVGALTSAMLNVPDRFRPERVFALSAFIGAGCNAAITAGDPGFALVGAMRFLTGVALAGVYPTGMKIMATWFRSGRGMAIGALVGALTVGSAMPHLFNALPFFGEEAGLPHWRAVLHTSSLAALASGVVALTLVRTGPILPIATHFHWRQAGAMFSNRAMRRANFGYFGHMWELYAMWTWAPIALLESYQRAQWSEQSARIAGFFIIAVGGVSSIIAGVFADRFGRTTITILSMIVSGLCAAIVGFLINDPRAMTIVCTIWGIAVIADSAQFSTAITELCDPRYVGTALTMQTCIGFLLTIVSIRLTPMLAGEYGWGVALGILALGPVVGVWSMARLRFSPEAAMMAGGRR